MNIPKLYSLVQFDNNEYAVMPSKRIKIIQGNNCVVKYPGGAKYNATIIHSSDSQPVVSELKKKLINDYSTKTSNKNVDENPAKCKQRSIVKNILQTETPNLEEDKNVMKEDDHLQSASDFKVSRKMEQKLIDNHRSKASGERSENNPSGCEPVKVKKSLGNGLQNSEKKDKMKRKADNRHGTFDSKVAKKMKQELIDNHLSEALGENSEDNPSGCELLEVTKVSQQESLDGKINRTYIKNRRMSKKINLNVSSEQNDDDIETLSGITFDENELNKAINLTNEDSSEICSVDHHNSIQGIGYSTPIEGSIILNLDLPIMFPKDMSDIVNQNQSTESSLPCSGLTAQLELLGPNWPDGSSEKSSAASRSPKTIESDNTSDKLVGDSEDQKNNDPGRKNEYFSTTTPSKDSVNFNDEYQNDLAEEDKSEPDVTNDSSSEGHQSTHDPTYEPSTISLATRDIAEKEKSSIEENPSLLDDLPAVDVRKLEVPVNAPGKGNLKRHFCIFCKTLQTKISRHFINKHSDEPEVKKFQFLPAKHVDRRAAIEELRKKGDFLHNNDKTLNTGILIISRRRSVKSKKIADDYTVCSSCKGHYAKSTIRFHYRRCCKSHKKRAKDILSSGRRITGYIHDVANPKLRREIFPVLRDDDIVKCIRYDEIIIKMGNKLCEKYALEHQHDYIRAQLRLIGRLKLELMKISSTFENFKNVFKPENFDHVITALKIVADWNPSTMLYNVPSNAQTLTTLLRKFAKKLRVEYVKENNNEQQKAVDNFLLLWDEEVPTLINKKAREDQVEKKREKKISLPSQSDIKLLYDHLKKESSHCLNILAEKFDKNAWILLNQSTLISIQIFNRRRPGEIERLKLINYRNKQTLADNLDASQYENLSETSFNFAKQFVRLVLRGKLGREVSILLSPFDVECIEVLMKFRNQAGISSDNDFIFANVNTTRLSKKYIRACPLMCRFANECGAAVPTLLRGTNLRKHIATHTAMLNIKETEVDRLAHFMGHSKDIHKNIYRIPVPIAEMTTVSHMLASAIGNNGQYDNEESDDSSSEEDGSDSSDGENDAYVSADLNDSLINKSQHTSKKPATSPCSTSIRNKWSDGEKYAITSEFGDLLKLSKLPSLKQCTEVINKYEVLKQRTPQQVKTWIDNQRRAESRQKSYQSKKKSY